MGIAVKEEHLLTDLIFVMGSELRRYCTHISFFKAVFMTCSHSFPYRLVLNVRTLTPCILTPSDFFNGTCHKTQSQNNCHPSINRHIRRRQPLTSSIHLISTCSLTPSLIEAVGPLHLLLGRACPLLREGSLRQFLRRSTVRFGSSHHPKWVSDG